MSEQLTTEFKFQRQQQNYHNRLFSRVQSIYKQQNPMNPFICPFTPTQPTKILSKNPIYLIELSDLQSSSREQIAHFQNRDHIPELNTNSAAIDFDRLLFNIDKNNTEESERKYLKEREIYNAHNLTKVEYSFQSVETNPQMFSRTFKEKGHCAWRIQQLLGRTQ
ncbi:Hypothetical_protein [Hexamita inflata]|uniref:Hypothetical_protein n=1 Tax=Hexamita inflata TaxID=28002 RepID=A0AA86NJW3_9EUKA|nr:Hypothetical protein HINF_LOCUS8119 [Hexamita inflata]